MDNRPIGLLDSGLGGLTVVKKVIAKLPNEKTVFIADQAHMPYGDRPKEAIIELTRRLVNFLLKKNVKLIVFGCNTATAMAKETIQRELDRQIIGVIQSGALAAAQTTINKRVGVIGTTATIASKAYQKAIHERDPQIEVLSLAAPKLAPLVEAGEKAINRQAIVDKSLMPLKGQGFDTLVLGCTHYPIIAPEIQQAVGSQVKLVDPADQVAQYTENVLRRDHLLSDGSQRPERTYFTTGSTDHFTASVCSWLQDQTINTSHVDL